MRVSRLFLVRDFTGRRVFRRPAGFRLSNSSAEISQARRRQRFPAVRHRAIFKLFVFFSSSLGGRKKTEKVKWRRWIGGNATAKTAVRWQPVRLRASSFSFSSPRENIRLRPVRFQKKIFSRRCRRRWLATVRAGSRVWRPRIFTPIFTPFRKWKRTKKDGKMASGLRFAEVRLTLDFIGFSACPGWWAMLDLDQRPLPCEGNALTN